MSSNLSFSPAVPLLENGESGDIVKEVDETKEA